jgi:hypothetical protein
VIINRCGHCKKLINWHSWLTRGVYASVAYGSCNCGDNVWRVTEPGRLKDFVYLPKDRE